MSDTQRHRGRQMLPTLRDGDAVDVVLGAVPVGGVAMLAGGGASRVVAHASGGVWLRGDASPYLELAPTDDVVGEVVAVHDEDGGTRPMRRGRLIAAIGLIGGLIYTLALHAANLIHVPLALLLAARRAPKRGAADTDDDDGARDTVEGLSMVPTLRSGDLLITRPSATRPAVGQVLAIVHPTRRVAHRAVLRVGDTYLEKGDAHLRFGTFRADAVAGEIVAAERLDGDSRPIGGVRSIVAALSLVCGLLWLPVGVVLGALVNVPLWLALTARAGARYLANSRMFGWFALPTALIFLAPALVALRGRPLDAHTWVVLGAAITASMFLSMATLMWNDVSDRDIDQVIHPERPIASGECAPGDILICSAVLAGVALGLAAWISPLYLALCGGHTVISIFHYAYAKRNVHFPGASELLTSLQNALIVPAGWAVAASLGAPIGPDLTAVLALAALLYLADVASDAASGVTDLPGDSLCGVSTFATTVEERGAARATAVFGVLAIGAGVVGLHALVVPWALWALFGALSLWVLVECTRFVLDASFDRAIDAYRATMWLSTGAVIALGGWAVWSRF